MSFEFKISRQTTVILSSLVAGSIILNNINNTGLLKGISEHVSKIFFARVDIGANSNRELFPKLQTFLKEKAYGGNATVVENGNDLILTGSMITFWPFTLVRVTPDTGDRLRAKIFHTKYFPPFTSYKMLEYLKGFDNSDNLVSFYTLSNCNGETIWEESRKLKRTSIPQLYTNDLIENVNRAVGQFSNSKLVSQKLGRTHKLTMLFYGPAGSGKTFCTKWLASHYRRNVYIIDPSRLFNSEAGNNSNLDNHTLFKHCTGGVLLFEDIDRYFATLFKQQKQPNISKFLNFLDGLCTPDNIIIILTCNCQSDIPDDIRRDGRIDLTVNFPFVNDEIKTKICQLFNVDSDQVTLEGNVTTSEAVKQIETSVESLQRKEPLTIKSNELPLETGSSWGEC